VQRFVRIVLTMSTTAALLGFIGAIFWWQDLQYSLPTPRPDFLRQKPIGTLIDLPSAIRERTTEARKPLLLHFFNPNCPCSRFNLDHVRALVKKYRGSVSFVAVLQGDAGERLLPAFNNLKLGIPAIEDAAAKIAGELGVYATPQAVIVDHAGQLFYRGNYNTNRYCTNRQTEFARLALDAALAGEEPPDTPTAASVAYGCPLPANSSRLQTRGSKRL
jgi:hypothetical protein